MCIFCERARASVGGDDIFADLAAQGNTVPLADRAAAESCGTLRARRIPCTLVTGFLGSGKTTLVNHILRGQHGRKLAVLENEAGEVAIDGDLLPSGADRMDAPEVVLLPNGCVCCKVRGDLVEALKRCTSKEGIEGVIIELSGLADIAPVAQTFFASDWAQSRLTLDAVVCVCDASRCAQLLPGKTMEAGEADIIRAQLQLADRIILNKIDKLQGGYEELALVERVVQEISPAAQLLSCSHGVVSPERLVGIDAFSLATSLDSQSSLAKLLQPDGHAHRHHHDAHGYSAQGAVESSGPLLWEKFQPWLASLLEENPQAALRFKGVLWTRGGPVAESKRGVLQGVAGHAEFTEGREWERGVSRSTKIVFIGSIPPGFREKLADGLRSCAAEWTPPPPPPPPSAAPATGGALAVKMSAMKSGRGIVDDLF